LAERSERRAGHRQLAEAKQRPQQGDPNQPHIAIHTDTDAADIARVARNEARNIAQWMVEKQGVDPEYARSSAYAHVVATLLNRAAYTGKSIRDVATAPVQFTGVDDWVNQQKKPFEAMPYDQEDLRAVNTALSDFQANGLGKYANAYNFLNPGESDQASLDQWGQKMLDQGAIQIGGGNAVHYVGNVDHRKIPNYAIDIVQPTPPERPPGLAQGGLAHERTQAGRMRGAIAGYGGGEFADDDRQARLRGFVRGYDNLAATRTPGVGKSDQLQDSMQEFNDELPDGVDGGMKRLYHAKGGLAQARKHFAEGGGDSDGGGDGGQGGGDDDSDGGGHDGLAGGSAQAATTSAAAAASASAARMAASATASAAARRTTRTTASVRTASPAASPAASPTTPTRPTWGSAASARTSWRWTRAAPRPSP
jgi:hypothetical protein